MKSRIRQLIGPRWSDYLYHKQRDAIIAKRLTFRQLGKDPDFIIAGTMKSGTTWLYDCLTLHPEIERALRKEVHYFDANYHRGPAWYRCHFPHRPGCKTGEASPLYSWHPRAMERISQDLPRVRILLVLRDPVQRTLSHFFHEVERGRETRPIAEALEAEPTRLAGELDKMHQDSAYQSFAYSHYSYQGRSLYADQVERCFSLFGRERVLVVCAEELFAKPREALSQVFAFLQVDPPPAFRIAPRSNEGRARVAVSDTLIQRLKADFEPHNEKLYRLLERRFSW